jgi:hypothetical protein
VRRSGCGSVLRSRDRVKDTIVDRCLGPVTLKVKDLVVIAAKQDRDRAFVLCAHLDAEHRSVSGQNLVTTATSRPVPTRFQNPDVRPTGNVDAFPAEVFREGLQKLETWKIPQTHDTSPNLQNKHTRQGRRVTHPFSSFCAHRHRLKPAFHAFGAGCSAGNSDFGRGGPLP